jgi:hypothetical protein
MLKQAGGVVHYLCGDVIGAADQISDVWESLVVTNSSNDLFDALVFQDRLSRNCCQEVPGDRCALP